jgi:lipopolysaccharide/colanic/teichoic acid biosynthesis glycosyltransferase
MRTRAPGKDFQEWIQYDIEYVDRKSPWLDLRIFVMTVMNVLRIGRKAESGEGSPGK